MKRCDLIIFVYWDKLKHISFFYWALYLWRFGFLLCFMIRCPCCSYYNILFLFVFTYCLCQEKSLIVAICIQVNNKYFHLILLSLFNHITIRRRRPHVDAAAGFVSPISSCFLPISSHLHRSMPSPVSHECPYATILWRVQVAHPRVILSLS